MNDDELTLADILDMYQWSWAAAEADRLITKCGDCAVPTDFPDVHEPVFGRALAARGLVIRDYRAEGGERVIESLFTCDCGAGVPEGVAICDECVAIEEAAQ